MATKKQTPKRMGAPPKPEAERRKFVIRVCVNEGERETLLAAAESAGAELSVWLRELGLRSAHRALAKEA